VRTAFWAFFGFLTNLFSLWAIFFFPFLWFHTFQVGLEIVSETVEEKLLFFFFQGLMGINLFAFGVRSYAGLSNLARVARAYLASSSWME